VYGEMAANDPVISSLLFAISMLIRNVEWNVEAADVSRQGMKYKEDVEEHLFQRISSSWSDVMSEICTMFTYGYAPMEIVWARRDGMIVPGKLALRSQETLFRWQFDDEDTQGGVNAKRASGEWTGFWQQDLIKPAVFIPREKMLLFRTESTLGNPEGRSILRGAYVPWVRKKTVEEAEGRAAIRAAGLVVMRLPSEVISDASYQTEYTAWKTLAANLASDRQGAIIMPSDVDPEKGTPRYDVDYVVADGRRRGDMTTIIERIDKRIVTTVLADFLLLGQQSVGSFALSSDKTALFATALWAWVMSIANVFNRDLLPRWWALNGWNEDKMPKIVPGDIETPNLQELASYLTALSGIGVQLLPDDNLEDYLRQAAGLPKPSPGQEAERERMAQEAQGGGEGDEEDDGGFGGIDYGSGEQSTKDEEDDDDEIF